MNYLTEIKLFNEWLETNNLSTAGISLWYGLMYIANRSGWKTELSIPVSAIILRTNMSRSTLYRERESLRQSGLIDYDSGDGRQTCIYRINGFEERLMSRVASHTGTQAGTQIDDEPEDSGEMSRIVSHPETQTGTQAEPEADDPEEMSRVASHTETQDGTQRDFVSHTGTQSGSIYKHKQDISLDKKEKINKNGGSGEKIKAAKSPKKKKTGFDLSFVGDEVWENLVRTWLDYKQSRNESYKSELSVKKFHTMLRNLSRGDPAVAGKIIDKSIANNWAGIFELGDSATTTSGSALANPLLRSGRSHPATGQRIGQIKQPEDEERRRQLLEKFDKKKP